MENSIFLAQAWGWYLCLVVLCLWLRPSNMTRWLKLGADAGLMWVSGAVALIVGLLTILSHNVWSDWAALITLLGWLSVLKGLARLMWPDVAARMMAKMAEQKTYLNTMLIICFALGLYLLYQGFVY